MGIKDLYKYFSAKHPDLFKLVHFSEFQYDKIAIDMMNLLYIYKARDDKNWMQNVLLFLIKLRNLYVHPICVFDGPTHPMKRNTVQKRKTEREKGKKRTEELRQSLNHYMETSEIQPNLQNLIDNRQDLVSQLSNQILVTQVEEYIEKQYKNYNIFFHTVDIDAMKEMIHLIGIDVISAPYDGEAYCSFLCANGMVSAVLSNDSDVFFFGCKKVICKFTEDGGYQIELQDILSKLQISHAEFIDLCILCGTDYNVSVKGIGFVRALNLIRKHRTLEELELLEKGVFEEVRKLTKISPSSLHAKWSVQPKDIKQIEYMFFKYNVQIDPANCAKKISSVEIEL